MADAGIVGGFLSAGVAGFALLLLIVAIAAWRRVGGVKLLALAGAFLLFFVKGLWEVLGVAGTVPLLVQPAEWQALDFGVLLLLYFGTVR